MYFNIHSLLTVSIHVLGSSSFLNLWGALQPQQTFASIKGFLQLIFYKCSCIAEYLLTDIDVVTHFNVINLWIYMLRNKQLNNNVSM